MQGEAMKNRGSPLTKMVTLLLVILPAEKIERLHVERVLTGAGKRLL
jgi:hypothetical protein